MASTTALLATLLLVSDEDLIESFVVRQTDLELIMDTVRENTHESNQHLLVIGPRGSGKTTLARRVAAEVRLDSVCNEHWYPLLFGEESYEVASAGLFWLEAIHHLGNQTGDSLWAGVYQDLLREPDEDRLGKMALGKLLDFADEEGKRILLVVENLNLILTEQLNEADGWNLRETLMNESRIMLLGSAISRFKAIENSNQAMYELFRTINLNPLSETECQAVWKMVTGKGIPDRQARAIRILTGGSPRLLTILSTFGANKSFQTLMEDLTYLVDDHTDYFKSNMENLPPQERKVFACLASLWEESSAKDIAEAARLTTSKASAQLKRLVDRGAVVVASQKGRKKTYQLAERLYNIYYLMRRGQDSERVKAVVRFMVGFYGENKLHEAAADIAREACGLSAKQRRHHHLALHEILCSPEAKNSQDKILSALPAEYLEQNDLPEMLRQLLKQTSKPPHEAMELFDKITANIKNNDFEAAEQNSRKALAISPEFGMSWGVLGVSLGLAGNLIEAEKVLQKAVSLDSTDSALWWVLGSTQRKLYAPEKAENSLRKSIELNSKRSEAWMELGNTLAQLAKPDEAEKAYKKVTQLDPQNAIGWYCLGRDFARRKKWDKAEPILRKSIELDPKSYNTWKMLGAVLMTKNKLDESETALRKAIELNPRDASALALRGLLLSRSGKTDEALKLINKALEIDLSMAWQLDTLDDHKELFTELLFKDNNKNSLLETTSEFLHDTSLIEPRIQQSTSIITALAATGLGQDVLEMVEASPCASLLEPLIAGLKLYLGQEIKAPQEVKEVAADVVKLIEEWEQLIEKAKREAK